MGMIYGQADNGSSPPIKVSADGSLSQEFSTTGLIDFLEASKYAITRVAAQGTSVATGSPSMTYSIDMSDVDMDTATLVLATSAGTVTVTGQVSYDGTTNKAPSSAITLFSAVSVGTYVVGLKALLNDGTNPIYGHYLTGGITIASAASNIMLFLMAQSR